MFLAVSRTNYNTTIFCFEALGVVDNDEKDLDIVAIIPKSDKIKSSIANFILANLQIFACKAEKM
jgi:hypothetical protein